MTDSLGERLKQTREARHLTLEQVAEQTRVRPHYLQALENDDLSAIPSGVQARGFLRIYAGFLGLNLDELASSARAAQSQTTNQTAASPTQESAASVQSNESDSEASAPRPNFFGGLRDRFTRRPAPETIAPEPAPEAEPEVFVPVRYHEELPAPPEPVTPEPMAEPEPEVKPARRKPASVKIAGRKKTLGSKRAKKPASKATRSSKSSAGGKAREKKKIAVSSR